MGKNKKRGNKNQNVKSPVKQDDAEKNKTIETGESSSTDPKLKTTVTETKIKTGSNEGVIQIESGNMDLLQTSNTKSQIITTKKTYTKTVTMKNGEIVSESTPGSGDILKEIKMENLDKDALMSMMNSDGGIMSISKSTSRNVCVTKTSTRSFTKIGPSPSVYFMWSSNENDGKLVSFYNEMKVTEGAQWTHFCPIGWSEGYMGLLDGHSKRIIMCLWNQVGDNDVEVLSTSDSVEISKFAHEGSGISASLAYDWKINTNYSFLLSANRGKPKTEYSGYFLDPDRNEWIKIGTFKVTPKRTGYISGMYSFIEDYMCSGASRAGLLGNAWFKRECGEWIRGDKVKINNTYTSNIPMSTAFTEKHKIGFSVGLGKTEHMKERVLYPSITEEPSILSSLPSV